MQHAGKKLNWIKEIIIINVAFNLINRFDFNFESIKYIEAINKSTYLPYLLEQPFFAALAYNIIDIS